MGTLAHVTIDADTVFTPLADTGGFIANGSPIRAEVRSAGLHVNGTVADVRRFCAALAEACDKADAANTRRVDPSVAALAPFPTGGAA